MLRAMNINEFIKKKFKLISVVSALQILIIVILITSACSPKLKDNDTVMTINGEPVSKAEFLFIMSGLRANVFSYFSQKYGVKDRKDLWTSSFEGEIPANKLKHNTIDKLKKIKIEQSLMRTYGLVADISYICFLKELKTENERRKVAVSKNQPIYGPFQYDENIYFDYLHTARIEKLKRILSTKELLINEGDVKTFYYQNKESKFKEPDYIKLEKISLTLTVGGKDVSSADNEKIELTASQILKQVRGGEGFKGVVSEYKKKQGDKIKYEVLIFDRSTVRGYTKTFPEISSVVYDFKINQISNTIREKETLNIIKVLDKKTNFYINPEEAGSLIRDELIEERYENLIRNLSDKAVIKLNEKSLQKITL